MAKNNFAVKTEKIRKALFRISQNLFFRLICSDEFFELLQKVLDL
jgi:hypothetical protein